MTIFSFCFPCRQRVAQYRHGFFGALFLQLDCGSWVSPPPQKGVVSGLGLGRFFFVSALYMKLMLISEPSEQMDSPPLPKLSPHHIWLLILLRRFHKFGELLGLPLLLFSSEEIVCFLSLNAGLPR